MKEKKSDNNFWKLQMEEALKKQSEEIIELKRLVVELGDKIVKDKEEKEKKIEQDQTAGISYWARDITPCNKNNFFVCAVCEIVPKTFHFLKVRVCSPNCSVIIEETINKSRKDLK